MCLSGNYFFAFWQKIKQEVNKRKSDVVFRRKEARRTEKLTAGKNKKGYRFLTISLIVWFVVCVEGPSPWKFPCR